MEPSYILILHLQPVMHSMARLSSRYDHKNHNYLSTIVGMVGIVALVAITAVS